jgi:hypothetical protein
MAEHCTLCNIGGRGVPLQLVLQKVLAHRLTRQEPADTTPEAKRVGVEASSSSVVETAQPEPPPKLATMSVTGQTKMGMSEASAEDAVMGWVSVPISPTPAATGRTVLEEALPQEGSALSSVGAGPS